jgi:hypothetical protein
MKKGVRSEYDEFPCEFAAFVTPICKLTEIGIQNKMNPKELMTYFTEVVGEFVRSMDKMAELAKESI